MHSSWQHKQGLCHPVRHTAATPQAPGLGEPTSAMAVYPMEASPMPKPAIPCSASGVLNTRSRPKRSASLGGAFGLWWWAVVVPRAQRWVTSHHAAFMHGRLLVSSPHRRLLRRLLPNRGPAVTSPLLVPLNPLPCRPPGPGSPQGRGRQGRPSPHRDAQGHPPTRAPAWHGAGRGSRLAGEVEQRHAEGGRRSARVEHWVRC